MRLGGSSKFVGVASISFCFAFRFVSRFTSTQTYVASIIKVFYVLVIARGEWPKCYVIQHKANRSILATVH